MRNQTCCFTGHRVLLQDKLLQIQTRLEEEVVKLIHQGVSYFGAGGALGFDTLAALTIIKLKQKYPQIRLILVLPCREQTKTWKAHDADVYQEILAQADKVVYTAEHYYAGCMQRRNRHLVEHSAFCICYLAQQCGGTCYTVHCAKRAGLQVLNLWGT